jgi:hypothetical protein
MASGTDVEQAVKRTLRQIRRRLPLGVSPDWARLLRSDLARWGEIRDAARNGPKVLIATSTGGHRAVASLESLLAVALTLRGASVHVLLCDKVLPACLKSEGIEFPNQASFVKDGPQRTLCDECFDTGRRIYEPLGLTTHLYSDLVTDAEQARASELASTIDARQIGNYEIDGVTVGEHALAGALKHVARGTLEGEPCGDAILRRYLKAALITMYATQELLRRHQFAAACFNHGLYVPPGVIGAVARQQGVRVVNWNPAYRKQCFIFSHGDTYHHTLMHEPTHVWDGLDWTAEMDQRLTAYLKSRWQGTQDWIWFHERPNEDLRSIAAEIKLDLTRTSVGLLTNVIWDAQLHYPANAFPDMMTWINETIRYFAARPELQLVIRVHPAEVRGWVPSRQPVVDEIAKAFPRLPGNVIVIPPESRVSTYAAMLNCDTVLIYGTKTGVELSSLGIPVIVAGEAWIRNKGIAMDANSADQYFAWLDRLPLRSAMSEPMTRRARMYAYHFFFRRMIPLSMTRPVSRWRPYEVDISGLDDLQAGRDPGLDVICDGILRGTDFIYPDETINVGRELAASSV